MPDPYAAHPLSTLTHLGDAQVAVQEARAAHAQTGLQPSNQVMIAVRAAVEALTQPEVENELVRSSRELRVGLAEVLNFPYAHTELRARAPKVFLALSTVTSARRARATAVYADPSMPAASHLRDARIAVNNLSGGPSDRVMLAVRATVDALAQPEVGRKVADLPKEARSELAQVLTFPYGANQLAERAPELVPILETALTVSGVERCM